MWQNTLDARGTLFWSIQKRTNIHIHRETLSTALLKYNGGLCVWAQIRTTEQLGKQCRHASYSSSIVEQFPKVHDLNRLVCVVLSSLPNAANSSNTSQQLYRIKHVKLINHAEHMQTGQAHRAHQEYQAYQRRHRHVLLGGLR